MERPLLCLLKTSVPLSAFTFLCRAALISVMQTSEVRNSDDVSVIRWRGSTRDGRVFRQGQVGPRLVVIGEIILEDPAQMPGVEDDHVVKTLSPNGTDNPFDMTVLPE